MTATLPLILLGAGGHAKVLVALARAAGLQLSAVCDPLLAKDGVAQWLDIPVLGSDDALNTLDPRVVGLINGIGQVPFGKLREDVFVRWRARGFHFPAVAHPSAWIAPDVVLEEGVQVMAGVIIQPGARIGMNTIVNTRVSIDHDCYIGAHVHIAPGAVLCGGITVQDQAFVGAGATIIQAVHIGADAVVGAGATVVRDMEDGAVLIGTKVRAHTPY